MLTVVQRRSTERPVDAEAADATSLPRRSHPAAPSRLGFTVTFLDSSLFWNSH